MEFTDTIGMMVLRRRRPLPTPPSAPLSLYKYLPPSPQSLTSISGKSFLQTLLRGKRPWHNIFTPTTARVPISIIAPAI